MGWGSPSRTVFPGWGDGHACMQAISINAIWQALDWIPPVRSGFRQLTKLIDD
jgi:hypothetical protein